MHIFIPTLGRPEKQVTLSKIPAAWLNKTHLVVQAHEYDQYHAYDNVIKLPEDIIRIEPTRAWLLKNAKQLTGDSKMLMLDDDLHFNVRRDPVKVNLSVPTEEEIDQMLKMVETCLDTYAHAGVSARQGNNRVEEDYSINTRMMRAIAYDTDKVLPHLQFGRVEIAEDFDYTLQLLRAGLPNVVIYKFSQGQGETQAKGGCSNWRTLELHNRNIEKLAELHPDFVRLREHKTKSGGDLSVRTEATIYWKKAFNS